MVAFHPIVPEIVERSWAEHVAAPAVDALPGSELAGLLARRPWSVLHGLGVTLDQRGPSGAANADHLERLRAAGAFRGGHGPALLLYRIEAGGHGQVGLVGDLDVVDCRGGRVRRHEQTETAKEAALSRRRDQLGADTSPVSLAYPPARSLDAYLGEFIADTVTGAHEDVSVHGRTAGAPVVSVTVADGTRHEIWPVTDPDIVATLVSEIRGLDAVYLLDGHHRVAAAARHAEGARGVGAGPHDPSRVLAALFPREHVRALDYRRVIRRPAALGGRDLLAEVGDRFTVTALAVGAAEATPQRRGEISLRLDGAWYRLVPRAHLVSPHLPDRLDEAIVQRHLLEPVLGVADPRTSSAISYVPGTVPLSELEERLDTEDVVVVLCPLPLAELQAVADAGVTLPPKSTYVTPKPAAGLILQPRHAPVLAAG